MQTIHDLQLLLMPTGEAATTLGCTPKHVAHLTHRGILEGLQTPLGRLYLRSDIAALAQKRATAPKNLRGHVVEVA